MHHLTKRWLKGYLDMNPDTAQDSSFNMKFLCIILRKKRRHAYKINPNITCLVIY